MNEDKEEAPGISDELALKIVEKAAERCERMSRGGGGRALLALKSDADMAEVRRAKAAFDAHRSAAEARGQECCLIVVGYASGREPFTLLGRVSADTGFESMPEPPLDFHEMQPVAHAAKMAFAKLLSKRGR